jgi:isopenicillin-N epimerase
MNNLRDHFLLNTDVIFLNHGSFGATPRPVFNVYQEWQRRLENQPLQFLEHQLPQLLAHARLALGDLINAPAADLVYVPNVTFGVNIVANSLNLSPGDEVLSTDHEYGACANVWRYLSAKRGFRFIQQPISLAESSQPISLADPSGSAEAGASTPTVEPWRTAESAQPFSQAESAQPIPLQGAANTPTSDQLPATIDQFWRGVTPKTKAIFLSHITSPTAQLMPVEEICARAAAEGILTIIDGAHAPGQIDLDLKALGADFYTGNCHKWLCAPKGSAFLYSREDRQPLIQPLVIGWGWGDDRPFTFGSDFLDYNQWLGTNDLAAYLAVPAAIEYQETNNWPAVRQQCQELAHQAAQRIGRLFHLPSLSTSDEHPLQMAIAPLLPTDDLRKAQSRFYQRYKIEVPFIQWRDHQLIRVSVQGYNNQNDIDVLLEALTEFFQT